MGQLKGNTDLNIALAGRATSNPLVGKQDLEFAFAASQNYYINLIAKFGLGFVGGYHITLEDGTIMLTEEGFAILVELASAHLLLEDGTMMQLEDGNYIRMQ
jgi:hypothetical protein